MPSKKIITLITNYLTYLINNNIKIDKCFLIGSYADGTQKPNSDIDILLISSAFLFPNDKDILYLLQITHNHNKNIHLHLLDMQRFNNSNPTHKNNFIYIDMYERGAKCFQINIPSNKSTSIKNK